MIKYYLSHSHPQSDPKVAGLGRVAPSVRDVEHLLARAEDLVKRVKVHGPSAVVSLLSQSGIQRVEGHAQGILLEEAVIALVWGNLNRFVHA